MRTIKFRIFDKINNQYLTENNSEYDDPFAISILGEILIKGDNGACGDEECCGAYEEYYSSYKNGERYIIEQFTGLTDKNGVEIYEGDILKDHGIVAWNEDEYRWSAIDLNWNDDREWHDIDYLNVPFEVIGNIYENPELIS